MSALDQFKRLRPDEQQAYLQRVLGGISDEPPQLQEMIAWCEEQSFDESVLPGGMTRREYEQSQARRQARMVDRPGDVERQNAALRARNEARARAERMGGYKPPLPFHEL